MHTTLAYSDNLMQVNNLGDAVVSDISEAIEHHETIDAHVSLAGAAVSQLFYHNLRFCPDDYNREQTLGFNLHLAALITNEAIKSIYIIKKILKYSSLFLLRRFKNHIFTTKPQKLDLAYIA
ncbi:hypothetical protein C4J81_03505 [Deltaproteobacteria bacterium Smac51]|nr:hypothetical protein C4J81_03505 [Deltaproteobacteria bacterium Smac51]